jgi:HEAT repeat protein
MGKGVSLWLAGNFKREAELPQGATDSTRGENQPDAQYYATASGTQYINPVLARALHDHNPQVALKAILSLQKIAGSSNLFTGESAGGQPLTEALSFPDRVIRYEAAYALAQANPAGDFTGKDRVVQILADSLNQTGKPNVVLLLPSQNDVNALSEALSDQYNVVGGPTTAAAVEQSAKLPGVDFIIVSEDLPEAEVTRMFDSANTSPRLDGAARVVVTHTPASRYAQMTLNNPMVSMTQATDATGIKAALTAARAKSGGIALTPETAATESLNAATVLATLAQTRNPVFDLKIAEQSLLAALNSPTPELTKAAGHALSHMNSKDAQTGLLDKSLDDKTPDDMKVELLGDVATSASTFGNQLDEGSVSRLEKAVHDAADLKVRSAASEVRGALNLPVDQAKRLILEQSKT